MKFYEEFFGGSSVIQLPSSSRYDMKKDLFRCFEIKVSMSGFKSKAAKSWQGNYNYLVLSKELYHQRPLDWWKNNVPKYVGIMVVNTTSSFFCRKAPGISADYGRTKRRSEKKLVKNFILSKRENL